MDRHLPDDQLDRALRGFFTERRDELLATAPTAHLIAARIAATSPTTPRRRQPLPLLLAALLVTLLAAAAGVAGSRILEPSPIPADRGVFRSTGTVIPVDWGHTATLLGDGRVLIVGRWQDSTGAAQIWGPMTNTLSPAGDLIEPRQGHTATLLPDGSVLVVGGRSSADEPSALTSSELWDPATSSFRSSGSLAEARYGHLAIALADSRVLVVGGDPSIDVLSAEIWDPATDAFEPATWSSTIGVVVAATLLDDGRVLLLGRTAAHIWDPVADTITATGRPIVGHVPTHAILLPDGRVAIFSGEERPSADIWDPRTQAFTQAGTAREAMNGTPTFTLLEDARVLVAGGWTAPWRGSGRCRLSCMAPTAHAEVWDPVSGTFVATGSMVSPRTDHSATLLADGHMLVMGHTTGVMESDVAELYELR